MNALFSKLVAKEVIIDKGYFEIKKLLEKVNKKINFQDLTK